MTTCNYQQLSADLNSFFKERIRPICATEFKKSFKSLELTPSEKVRLFLGMVRKFSLVPIETNNLKEKYGEYTQRYIFEPDLRSTLSSRLSPTRVEILCLSERVFRRVGRKNSLEETKIQKRINVLLGVEPDSLENAPLDLTPVKSDEEQEIENLKAKLSQLQKELEEREAAFEKKNRLSKTGKEILEMFNLSLDDLKEIVSIL